MADKQVSIFEKLAIIREEFLNAGAKKTGKNPHAEFMYFELNDIIPIGNPIMKAHKLVFHITFENGNACGKLVDFESNEQIAWTVPFVTIAEPGKFRMNEIQGMGAAVTYYRRYLYMLLFDIIEADEIDGASGKQEKQKAEEKPKAEAKPKTKSSAPATAETRKEAVEKLTSEDGNASPTQLKALKAALKKLKDLDPNNEEFCHQVALQSKNFTEFPLKEAKDIMAKIKEFIEMYKKEGKK